MPILKCFKYRCELSLESIIMKVSCRKQLCCRKTFTFLRLLFPGIKDISLYVNKLSNKPQSREMLQLFNSFPVKLWHIIFLLTKSQLTCSVQNKSLKVTCLACCGKNLRTYLSTLSVQILISRSIPFSRMLDELSE